MNGATMKTFLKMICILSLLIPAFMPAVAAPAAVQATEIDFAALDRAVEAQMSKHGLPGVALAVIEGDETIYLQGYGTAGGRAMTPQTQMFIGSQSKSFTALLIAQLSEQGKLDLKAPVQAYLPDLKVADEQASTRITINHLLHHTSGLSESGYSVLLPDNATCQEAVSSLSQARLTAPVGQKFQYFNLGYDVLTCTIESVTGQRYADYLKLYVLDPLGMSHTTADPTTIENLSSGYTRLFGFALPMKQPVRDFEVGAGYIVSTAEDMARYALAMKNGAEGLVQPATAQAIFTPGLGAYGMGWHIVDGGAKIFHGGANETFHTEVNLYPKRDRAFVLLVNEGHQVDHFISMGQLTSSVEAVVLGRTPPPVSQGWSVRWVGWALGVLVLALVAIHTRSFYVLFNSWIEKARRMPPLKKAWNVAFSFVIPTAIIIIVFSQLKAFYGYRFNLLTTLAYMRLGLPDVFILMLVGTLPDYIQGCVKLAWVLGGRTKSD
jgi:CubicO group peptidase (beta-lactamase class C family)